jgi:hypothetical protein
MFGPRPAITLIEKEVKVQLLRCCLSTLKWSKRKEDKKKELTSARYS